MKGFVLVWRVAVSPNSFCVASKYCDSGWFGQRLFTIHNRYRFSTHATIRCVCANIVSIVESSKSSPTITSHFIPSPKQHFGWPKAGHRLYIVSLVITLLVVIVLWWRRRRILVRKLAVRNRPSIAEIGPAIADFYDSRSRLWEKLCGEHMHHGYYGESGNEKKDRIRAQEDMMEELWKFAELDIILSTNHPVIRILDVGCGIGGAARYLAKKSESIYVTGITLSKTQAERGNALTKEQNLQGRVQLVVADAHHIPFPDNSFDIVWSLESGEHMADKYLFLSELYRVLKPKGKLAMVVWCHRKCPPPLSDEERVILYSIYKAYRLPYICSLEELANIAWRLGLTGLKEADWSDSAFPFWIQVLQTAFSAEAIAEWRNTDWDTIRSVFAIRHMLQASIRKLLVLGVLSGTKRPLQVFENK